MYSCRYKEGEFSAMDHYSLQDVGVFAVDVNTSRRQCSNFFKCSQTIRVDHSVPPGRLEMR